MSLSTTVHGRAFTFIHTEPYTCRDGRSSRLHVWAVTCAGPGCTCVIEVRTPALDTGGVEHPPGEENRQRSLQYTRRYCGRACAPHPGPSAQRRTLATTYASRTRVSDAEVAALRALACSPEFSSVPRAALYEALSVVVPLAPLTIREILAGRKRVPRSAECAGTTPGVPR